VTEIVKGTAKRLQQYRWIVLVALTSAPFQRKQIVRATSARISQETVPNNFLAWPIGGMCHEDVYCTDPFCRGLDAL
jgi:hypothetical protein